VFSLFFSGIYEEINIIGYTSSRKTGITSDSLIIDSGYSSGMTSNQWFISLGFLLNLWPYNHNLIALVLYNN